MLVRMKVERTRCVAYLLEGPINIGIDDHMVYGVLHFLCSSCGDDWLTSGGEEQQCRHCRKHFVWDEEGWTESA